MATQTYFLVFAFLIALVPALLFLLFGSLCLLLFGVLSSLGVCSVSEDQALCF
jgi:hypothetical protein